jgi:hypothetical protein
MNAIDLLRQWRRDADWCERHAGENPSDLTERADLTEGYLEREREMSGIRGRLISEYGIDPLRYERRTK